MATDHYKQHELGENLTTLRVLLPEIAQALGVSTGQAAKFMIHTMDELRLVMYLLANDTGLWRPNGGFISEEDVASLHLSAAWSSSESQAWSDESCLQWESMRLNSHDAAELREHVETIRRSGTEVVDPVTENQNENIDPSDLPEELDAANMAYRAVLNGFDILTGTFKNKLIEFLSTNYSHLGNEALDRIATVANPDKTRGRKKRNTE